MDTDSCRDCSDAVNFLNPITKDSVLSLATISKLFGSMFWLCFALSIASMHFCTAIGVVMKIPDAFVGTCVVYPVKVTIQGAFKRREKALKCFASIKGLLTSIYCAHRDWARLGLPDVENIRPESRYFAMLAGEPLR